MENFLDSCEFNRIKADAAADEDLAVVEQFKAGYVEVFSQLVNKYKKPIYNLVYRLMGSGEDVEDLAQEVFLRAYRGLPGFKAEAKFYTWLYRIAVNLALRARQRKSKFVFQSIEQKEEAGNSEIKDALAVCSDPQSEMEKSELCSQVRKAIMELSDEHRTVVILSRYHNMQYEEIARMLDISVPAVKSRLHRARKVLKDKLESYVKE